MLASRSKPRLRGIDAAFDRYDQRPSKTKKVNSLAYCSQEVLAAAEDMKEAAVGAAVDQQSSAKSGAGQGFEPEMIAAFLRRNADLLERAQAAAPHSNLRSYHRRRFRRHAPQTGEGS